MMKKAVMFAWYRVSTTEHGRERKKDRKGQKLMQCEEPGKNAI